MFWLALNAVRARTWSGEKVILLVFVCTAVLIGGTAVHIVCTAVNIARLSTFLLTLYVGIPGNSILLLKLNKAAPLLQN